MGRTRYFEEFEIGEKAVSHSRQLDIADSRLFGCATGLGHRIYSDMLFCRTRPELMRPIIPFSMALNVIDVFFAHTISPDNIPTFHYGYDRVDYLKNIYPGDSIYTEFEVTDMTVRNDKFGVLTLNATTYNQDGDVVIFHVDKLYVGRKPQ